MTDEIIGKRSIHAGFQRDSLLKIIREPISPEQENGAANTGKGTSLSVEKAPLQRRPPLFGQMAD